LNDIGREAITIKIEKVKKDFVDGMLDEIGNKEWVQCWRAKSRKKATWDVKNISMTCIG
jgi:hypothetical protein